MSIAINSSTSGFGKWLEAQELKRRGKARAETDEGTIFRGSAVDQGVMPPAEQPHRPWLVPGAGKL
jgi:hypothetical protein